MHFCRGLKIMSLISELIFDATYNSSQLLLNFGCLHYDRIKNNRKIWISVPHLECSVSVRKREATGRGSLWGQRLLPSSRARDESPRTGWNQSTSGHLNS